MGKSIILLDIDDCILPSTQTYFGDPCDSLDILKINCLRLQMICEKWDICIQIISSCSLSSLKFENGELFYPEYKLNIKDKHLHVFEYQAFKIIKKYLEKYVISLSSGNKERDIKNKIMDPLFKNVIVIEDTDFSHSVNSNNGSYYLETLGYISNYHGYIIKTIIEGDKIENIQRSTRSNKQY